MSRLDLVAGPNGAGKSTFVRLTLAPQRPGVPLVNAHVIAAQAAPDDPMPYAHQAAATAAATRDELIRRGHPFIAETVFSHASKVDLAREALDAGFDVRLHVNMVPEHLAVARVSYRVRNGGHDVPEHKVREQYQRLWALVAQTAGFVPVSKFWANDEHDGPRLIATFSEGIAADDVVLPGWSILTCLASSGGTVEAD